MIDELDLYIDALTDDSEPEAEPEPEVSAEEAIAFLRASLEPSLSSVFPTPLAHECISDSSLVRWFISRGRSLERAEKALQRHCQWRQEQGVSSISKESVEKELANDFIVFGGPDTDGFPCVFVFVRNHDKDASTPDEMEKLIIYILEEALRKCAEMRAQQAREGEDKYRDQFTLIFDLWGFNLQCMNYKAIASLVQVARYNYPYVIRRVLIVNTPWLFGACYKIIEKFLPPDAQSLIGFANCYDEMSAYVEPRRLPEQTIFAKPKVEKEGDECEDGEE